MIKLLIIAHNHIGQEIIKTAKEIINKDTCRARVVSIYHSKSYEEQLDETRTVLNSITDQNNLVIMTDLKGASPYNIAKEASKGQIPIICGLSLEKVIQFYNYCNLPAQELINKLQASDLY